MARTLPSLLILFLLQTTTTLAHPLTKRRGGGRGGGGGGGGGGGSSASSASAYESWKIVVAVLGSILGTSLLLYIIFSVCVPRERTYDWAKRIRNEWARRWARHEAGDANASANGKRGRAGMEERGTAYRMLVGTEQ